MAIDLFILALIAVFGLLGGLTGAARQIGQLVGLLVAYAVAGPLGKALGPTMAGWLGGVPLVAGTVAATLALFIVIWVGLRQVVAAVARRAMSGDDPEDQTVDRNLGMIISAVKIALATYVVLCALVFAERNVTAFGKGLGVSPRDSLAFDLARKHNLFEMTQFSSVRDYLKVAGAATDPARLKKLRTLPAFAALEKDPRWKKALQDPEVKRALEAGDVQALLRNDSVARLLSDGEAKEKIESASGGDW
ncbi:MAG TPA: CvpA family protein [Myxococcales bacterium]|nr:CvpA family protein [Myxococcales bacterium]